MAVTTGRSTVNVSLAEDSLNGAEDGASGTLATRADRKPGLSVNPSEFIAYSLNLTVSPVKAGPRITVCSKRYGSAIIYTGSLPV